MDAAIRIQNQDGKDRNTTGSRFDYTLARYTPPLRPPISFLALASLSFHHTLSLRLRSLRDLSTAQTRLGRLTTPSTPLEHLTFSLCVRTSILNGGRVSIVGVDPHQEVTVLGSYAFNVDVALALLAAVATAAVEFAVVFDILLVYC